VPLALLADTECEAFEEALQTNLLGPFRLTRAVLGALAASAREGRAGLVLNVGSDAAQTPYARWGAYGASKAALVHLSRIWDEELRGSGVRVLALDPGDMDTPLHALAVPDADPATLKPPAVAAQDLMAAMQQALQAPAARERA
jgi:NAD(P)-dependent dehydrogenase (short-subunit alcohol dehydrogenase family)